jgi:type 2A phosphatase activator TIP41
MPDCIFVLARFFLRIDGVLLRIYDTRVYHEFRTSIVVRERVEREAKHGEVDPKVVNDPDRAALQMAIVSKHTDNFVLIPSSAA